MLQADVLLVLVQLKEKRYDQAVADSTALEQRRPDSPIAYNLTGLALLAQGKLDEASARFEKAFEIDPAFNTALINLARVDVAKDDVDGAARRYRQVLEQDPRNLAASARHGRPGGAESTTSGAVLEWLNKAQDANAAAVQPGLLLTRYYIDRSEYLQALTIASNLATRFPDNVNALEMLGRAQTLAGEEASAIRTFDQILSKEPNDAAHALPEGRRAMEGRRPRGCSGLLSSRHRPEAGLRRCAGRTRLGCPRRRRLMPRRKRPHAPCKRIIPSGISATGSRAWCCSRPASPPTRWRR